MTEQERSEQQWDRAKLALAYQVIGSRWHSGQWSVGYRKLSQAQNILDELGYQPGACYDAERDPEIRELAAVILFTHRHEIAREW